MGVRFPDKAGVTWIRVNSEPQFHQGETLPYQVFIMIEEIQK